MLTAGILSANHGTIGSGRGAPTALLHRVSRTARRNREEPFMPGEYTLCPKGEIDLSTAPLLRAEWEAAVDVHRPERLIIDLSDVTFLDSSGISLVVTIYKRQRSHDGVVMITNAS